MFIDADSHIDECEQTWDFIPEKYSDLRPLNVEVNDKNVPAWYFDEKAGARFTREWLIDGMVYPRPIRSDEKTGTTEATREMKDVAARVRDIDELSIDVQAVFPTAMLRENSLRAPVCIAMCRSYNTWISQRCAESNGRLRWVAAVPFVSMPDALEELEFAKRNGAVAVRKQALECHDLWPDDPYFYPVYDLAAQLDIPVAIHTGQPWRPQHDSLSTFKGKQSGHDVAQGFGMLAKAKVTDKFPGLRIGFIEAGAAWVQWAAHIYRLDLSPKMLSDLNLYVTCEASEDIPYLVEHLGYDNLMVGTDYTHDDRASVGNMHQSIANRTDLSPGAIRAITEQAGHAFYNV